MVSHEAEPAITAPNLDAVIQPEVVHAKNSALIAWQGTIDLTSLTAADKDTQGFLQVKQALELMVGSVAEISYTNGFKAGIEHQKNLEEGEK